MSVRVLTIREILASRSERVESGCLEWSWARDWDGYGMQHIDGHQRRAHRLAWKEANGPIPEGLVVRHECDNPPCIELDHLTLGTVAENNADRESRGRGADRRGERCPTSKLTWADVATVRELLADGLTHREVAARFAVTREAISSIAQGRTWRRANEPSIQHAC